MATPQDVRTFEEDITMLPESSLVASEDSCEPSDTALNETIGVPGWITLGDLAERYQVSERTIQNWLKRIVDECQVPDSQLRIQHGQEVEFTSYCTELLDGLTSHRQVHGSKKISSWFSNLAEKQKKTSSSTISSNPKPSTSDAGDPSGTSALAKVGVVPTDIPLATDEQHSILDTAIQHLSPVTVDLNGQQDANLDGIEVLLTVVEQATTLNDQKQAELAQRQETLEKSEQVLELIQDRLQDEQTRSKKLNKTAAEIAEREQQVSDLLGKFI